jgi:hypothetical protein
LLFQCVRVVAPFKSCGLVSVTPFKNGGEGFVQIQFGKRSLMVQGIGSLQPAAPLVVKAQDTLDLNVYLVKGGQVQDWGASTQLKLAQLSQLPENFVFFRRLTTAEGSSTQNRGSKSAYRGDLLSSRGKFFNYNVVL